MRADDACHAIKAGRRVVGKPGPLYRKGWQARAWPALAEHAALGEMAGARRGDFAKISADSNQGALMPTISELMQNQLLAALPQQELARWLPDMERVEMPLGQVLYEPGSNVTHVYFPTTSIVSLLYVMENGASAEIAVAGNEGIVGISLFMGGESTTSRAVVQSAGVGFRINARLLMMEFTRGCCKRTKPGTAPETR
jgi:hypothetical protein